MVDSAKAENILSWMNEGAPPHRDGRAIVDDLCRRMVDADIDIGRFALFIFTIHPTIRGRRIGWSPKNGAEMFSAGHGIFTTDLYHNNPIPKVIEEKISIRRRLADPDCPNDYIIVDELRADGLTDYFIAPLLFVSGEVHCASWTAQNTNGFSDKDISFFKEIAHPLARLTEIYMLRLNSGALLSTYIGRNAGNKVLNGQIKLGDGEDIQAVIMFADLKDFTSRSNNQNSADTLAMLNRFFGALEISIREQKGEILKFMGDGLLAIFPYDNSRKDKKRAVEAANNSLAGARRQLDPDIGTEGEFRAALHMGEIHYGNIGGERRLDFTAIGPAVNLTARLLSNAERVDSDFVCSSEVADLLEITAEKSKTIKVKGFEMPQTIFPLPAISEQI